MTRHFRALTAAAIAVLAGVVTLSGQRGAAPPVPTTQTPAPAIGTGAISGVVVDGATGQPIAGAVVSIGVGGRGAAQPDPGKLATDGNGRFVFTRLSAASYSLSAAKHGYGAARYGETDPGSGSARSIALADGQWFPDGRIVMWRTGAISGTVTDESGEPLVGVLVRVLMRATVAGRPQLASGAGARTDDLGHYRVAGLAPGSYVVLVPSVQAAVPSGLTLDELSGLTPESYKAAEAAGRTVSVADPVAIVVDASNRLIAGNYVTPPPVASGAAWSYPPTFFPGAQTIANATTIDLARAEQREGINVRLTPVRTVRVSGVVQGPPGATPARMTVRVLPAGSEALGYGSEIATALVAADGSFTLLNVTAGAHTIVVSRNSMEYQSSDGSFASTPAPPGCTGGGGGFFTLGTSPGSLRASYRNCAGDASFSARLPLAVGDRDMRDVLVTLVKAVSISGRVISEAPPNPDLPISRILSIFAEPGNGDPLLGLPSGRTAPDDPTRFRIDGLLPGAYVLNVPAGGAGQLKSIEWQGRDYTGRSFDTTPGRDIADVTVTLTGQPTIMRGTVRDAKGTVATSGMVIAFPTDRSLWMNYGLRPARLQSSGISATGSYALSLPAGDYFVTGVDASGSVDWKDPRFLDAASAAGSRITVVWGETKMADVSLVTIKVNR